MGNNDLSEKIKEIDLSELELEISVLANKTSSDSYGISNLMIKKLPTNAKKKLVKLFNLSIKNNLIPLNWKRAELFMLQKKPHNKSKITNYRS